MLLTLLMNLDAFGPPTPPPPPTPTAGGAKAPEQLALEAHKKLVERDEEDFIILMAGWIADKSQEN